MLGRQLEAASPPPRHGATRPAPGPGSGISDSVPGRVTRSGAPQPGSHGGPSHGAWAWRNLGAGGLRRAGEDQRT